MVSEKREKKISIEDLKPKLTYLEMGDEEYQLNFNDYDMFNTVLKKGHYLVNYDT